MPGPAFAYYTPSPTLQERLNQINQKIAANNGQLSSEIKEEIRTFFLVSHAVIEEHTGKLIYSEVIDASAKNQAVIDYLLGESRPSMGQIHREEILRRAEVISGSLFSDLQEVRGARNQLAHQYATPIDWHGELEATAEQAIEAFDELHEICLNS